MAHDPATPARISPPSYQPSWVEPSLSLDAGPVRVWSLALPEWPRGVCLTCNTSGHHNAAVASLSSLLEPADAIPPKYWLSAKACAGILRRASARGKELPEALRVALEAATR
jgi:hypothetical protein